MTTAAAMAALRAKALGNCGGGSCNEDGYRDSRGKDNGNRATALVMIALVALAIAHFVTSNIVANAITCVVAIAIAFVSVQQRG
jgi:hypothetical protein